VAVFANVLVTRLGAPLPAIPVLVFAGSAIAGGSLVFSHVLCAAVLAALIGDCVWFSAGRIYGRRLTHILGRMSLSLDASVRTARALFERFGVPIVAVVITMISFYRANQEERVARLQEHLPGQELVSVDVSPSEPSGEVVISSGKGVARS